MLASRRFKTTAVFVALAVLLIGAVGVYARTTTHGTNKKVYWDVMVDRLRRSGNRTHSSHQYYIENDSDVAVTLIEQEFKHRVMQKFTDGKADKERISISNDDIDDAVKIPSKTSTRRFFAQYADISGLGMGAYYINAYTRINIKEITEKPAPKAEESSRTFIIR